MGCGPCKLRRFVAWSPASVQVLKFDMDKTRPAVISGVLCNNKVVCFAIVRVRF